MPLASSRGVRPFYGDLHNHCNLSYGHGSLGDALKNARRQLDFVSVTGHAYWPDMPVDEPSVAHIVDFHIKGFARLEKRWPEHFAELSEYNEPGRFTVFPGYEIHSCEHGDYTIVLRSLEPQELAKADSPEELQAKLQSVYDGQAFAFPHHIGYRTGARGINWASFRESLSPVLEMISMHGCSETSLTEYPFLHSMGPADGPNTVYQGLNEGHVFGLLGNTDHHSGYPGSYGHGRSAIYAGENSGDAIWQAILDRRSNALTGDNAHLFISLNDAMQGEFVSPVEDASIAIEAIGGSFIDHIDVIKNGALVERISPELTPNPIASGDGSLETIMVLELGWGSRGTHHDWDGKIKLENGELLSLEPRLRGPEIVSPLDGPASSEFESRVENAADAIEFSIRSYANPNNRTPTTQSIAARVRLSPDANIMADFGGRKITVSPQRLLAGALTGNVGPIDSPAFRFHPLPLPGQWQWHGKVGVGSLQSGDWLLVRMRQKNGQWAWTSPIFCR